MRASFLRQEPAPVPTQDAVTPRRPRRQHYGIINADLGSPGSPPLRVNALNSNRNISRLVQQHQAVIDLTSDEEDESDNEKIKPGEHWGVASSDTRTSKAIRYQSDSSDSSLASSSSEDDSSDDTGRKRSLPSVSNLAPGSKVAVRMMMMERAKMNKRMKNYKRKVDILTSQLESKGVKAMKEVVSYDKAQQYLKENLQKLMEGDETAEKDFEKWDGE